VCGFNRLSKARILVSGLNGTAAEVT